MSTLTSPKKTAKDWGAWIWVKWKAGAPEAAWKPWQKNKNIKEAWTTSGDWDWVMWIDSHDPEDVKNFVWEEVRTNKWVEKTDTHWVKKCW